MPITLGRHTILDGGIVNNDYDVTIEVGNYTSIAKNLTVFGKMASHAPINTPECVSTYNFDEFLEWDYYLPRTGKGPIVIGSDVWIGRNATFLDGITIGHGAIVGACAVVAKNVPPYAVVVGNPCRVVK
jgi:virginiamycin A acetyltransferase